MISLLLSIILGVVLALNSSSNPPPNDTKSGEEGSTDMILRASGLGLRRELSQDPCDSHLVSYPRASDAETKPLNCKFPVKMKHSSWSVRRSRDFNSSNATDWLGLFQDDSFALQPRCLQFKIDYIVQEDTGLAEIRITVICGSRRMHALRISVDSYENAATKVFEFNEHSQIVQGNCSNIVDVMFQLYIYRELHILRNNSYALLVLGEWIYDFRPSNCDCSGFERFERRMGWCGGVIFKAEFFEQRFYVILSVLLGTGLLVTISLSVCKLIQGHVK